MHDCDDHDASKGVGGGGWYRHCTWRSTPRHGTRENTLLVDGMGNVGAAWLCNIQRQVTYTGKDVHYTLLHKLNL
nr:hypothetical protein CFP56_04445 [Quercus suber]